MKRKGKREKPKRKQKILTIMEKKTEKLLGQIERKPIGEILLEAGVITEDQLREALEHQKRSIGKRIGTILVELGYISEAKLKEFLERQLKVLILDLFGDED